MKELGITLLVAISIFAAYILFLKDQESILHQGIFQIDKALVFGIVDGDSFNIVRVDRPGQVIAVDAYLIDAPEPGECYYEESKGFAQKTLFSKEIWIAYLKDTEIQNLKEAVRVLIFFDENLTQLWQADAVKAGAAQVSINLAEEQQYRSQMETIQRFSFLRKDGRWDVCE